MRYGPRALLQDHPMWFLTATLTVVLDLAVSLLQSKYRLFSGVDRVVGEGSRGRGGEGGEHVSATM